MTISVRARMKQIRATIHSLEINAVLAENGGHPANPANAMPAVAAQRRSMAAAKRDELAAYERGDHDEGGDE